MGSGDNSGEEVRTPASNGVGAIFDRIREVRLLNGFDAEMQDALRGLQARYHDRDSLLVLMTDEEAKRAKFARWLYEHEKLREDL